MWLELKLRRSRVVGWYGGVGRRVQGAAKVSHLAAKKDWKGLAQLTTWQYGVRRVLCRSGRINNSPISIFATSPCLSAIENAWTFRVKSRYCSVVCQLLLPRTLFAPMCECLCYGVCGSSLGRKTKKIQDRGWNALPGDAWWWLHVQSHDWCANDP